MTRSDLTNELMTNFMLIKRRLYQGMLQDTRHNATPVQMQIIHLISTGITKIALIAKELNISGSAVSQHVNTLVAEGWVVRTEGTDRRETHLTLSPEMADIIDKHKRRVHADMLELTSTLSESEFSQLIHLLQKINQRN